MYCQSNGTQTTHKKVTGQFRQNTNLFDSIWNTAIFMHSKLPLPLRLTDLKTSQFVKASNNFISHKFSSAPLWKIYIYPDGWRLDRMILQIHIIMVFFLCYVWTMVTVRWQEVTLRNIFWTKYVGRSGH